MRCKYCGGTLYQKVMLWCREDELLSFLRCGGSTGIVGVSVGKFLRGGMNDK